MDVHEINRLFLLLHEYYPNARITTARMEAWRLGLEPYSYDDAKRAVVEYARHGRYFPDLCDICGRIERKPVGEIERRSVAALMREEVG